MKIGVVGNGVVGRAIARAWLEHVDEVRVCDRLKERSTHDPFQVVQCDLVFVALPEGEVEGWFQAIHPQLRDVNYVLKSTVPIGTTRRLCESHGFVNLVHAPEFLTARCSIADAQMPARNVIGIPDLSRVPQCETTLSRLYERRFPGVPIYVMKSEESEALKLIQNAFFAVKISFFNEAYSLCDALGLNWEVVREALLADGRIHSSHTRVPGPDGLRGWGGACLGKDTEAFRDALVSLGLPFDMSQAALMRNIYDRGRAPS